MNFPVVLAIDQGGFGVPYARPESDTSSHSYINLKKHPEQIDLIPEVQDWPELKAAIIRINSVEGPFQTLGCSSWVYHSTDGSGLLKVVSYIGFCQDSIEPNQNLSAYYGMFHEFSAFLSKKELPEELHMYFVIRPTGFHGDMEGVGWSAELGIGADGASVEEARTMPSLAYSLLTEFLFSIVEYVPRTE
jgi:hypothetical protein